MLEQEAQATGKRGWRGAMILFAGVILPAISIAVETTTHICAEDFFDPIPTLWHVLLVIFVPLAHLQAWLAIRKGHTSRGALLGLTNAVAIGIAIFYTIVYIPLLPLAAIALIFAGLGLLPLAPLSALVSGIILRRQLRGIVPQGFSVRTKGLAAGLTLAFAAIVLIELPATLTRAGLQMAASESTAQSERGLRWLRAVGNRDYLLRACYERSGRATDLIGFLFSLKEPVTPDEARAVFYRLTGETFDTRMPPERLKGHWQPQDSFDFDPDQGGEVVAGKVKNLSLASSRIDGSVDADAGIGYVEWTLLFKNDSAIQQEARSQVELPPGAVVSRLTLWVNGEEREAAFAGRSSVREAYRQVAVRQQRDPVLVTTAGTDRVLVQCFPVGANGGEMKIRLGITTPLQLPVRNEGLLRLPHFTERNFGIPGKVTHAVWIESKEPLRSNSKSLQTEQPASNLHAIRGALRDAELSEPLAVVHSMRASEITEAWTHDAQKKDGEIVRQVIKEREPNSSSHIILVLDTSQRMRSSIPEIIAALETLPPNIELKIVLAGGNGVYEESPDGPVPSGSPIEIARQLKGIGFEGGANNVPALVKAWNIAAGNPESAIVWIHAPQTLLLQPVEELRQRRERRPANVPMLYSVQTENGADRIEEKLDGAHLITGIARMNPLRIDLEKLFAELTGQRKTLEFVRTNEPAAETNKSPATKETSAHLAKLWANDEVERLTNAKEKNGVEDAVKLAVLYQLVTPVSGAVVLETQEQYQRAGLEPVEGGTVPTIPEPETWLLIAVVAAIFLWMLYRQKLLRGRFA